MNLPSSSQNKEIILSLQFADIAKSIKKNKLD
jgi:hypothetical protein